jgi:hypothetical protein
MDQHKRALLRKAFRCLGIDLFKSITLSISPDYQDI